MIGLLALARDQAVEGELALTLDAILDTGALPDLPILRTCFTPPAASAPVVVVQIPSLSVYDRLMQSALPEGIAA